MATPTQTEPLQLSVSNFGPIAKAEVDLRPLTVFVGPSNTGKSYLAILIYALHRFFGNCTDNWYFGYRRMSPILRRKLEEQQVLVDDNVKMIVDWMSDLFVQVNTEGPSDGSLIQLPDFIGAIGHHLFSDLNNFNEDIVEEVQRSFGIEDTARLVRRSMREGAKITVRFKPFKYELALKRSKSEGAVIWTSEETPLYIDPHAERMKSVLVEIFSPLNTLGPEDKNRKRQDVEDLIREFFSLVLADAVSPLNNAAHYLPADRTGVMHSHRVVVASLIERASHAGLRRGKPLPSLSGVLADFLENLVGLGEPRRRRDNKGNLATNLEQQILKGQIHSQNSETGYPMFSYQPQGWREDLPLMNVSSMVSELAPVVLYLRHIVQPGDVLIIEEPESHLHPKMQVEFIRQLAAVVQSGIRVMLTTHSEWVLDELANLVHLWGLPKTRRKGVEGADFALNPEEVGVWLFEPKQRPKGSVVKEVPFDAEYGGFRSGFDEVAMGTYNDYAEISNRIEGWK